MSAVICERPLSSKEEFLKNIALSRQNEKRRLVCKYRDQINHAIDLNDSKPKDWFFTQLDKATAALVEFEQSDYGDNSTEVARAIHFLF
jgi:hypothetical protein